MAELKKAIGPWRGTAMMLNIVLGAGLLTLPGLAAAAAGSGALVVWGASAVVAVPLLVVFGILGRAYPDAGGLAVFLKQAFGDAGRACATFLFLGAVAFGLPAIALTGGHYAAAVLGGPPALYAMLLILGATAANLASSEIAGRVNAALASVILVVLVAIAVVGWIAVTPDVSKAVALESLPSPTVFGLTFMMVFFAFTGWEVSANLSGEFHNPRRDFPIAMAASFVIAVALYLVLALIVAASGPIGANEAPFAAILGHHFGPAGSATVSCISVLLIFANLSAAIWAVSRMVYSGAVDRLLPPGLARLKSGVPLRAVAVTTTVLLAVAGASGAGLVDLGWLLGAAGLNFLLLYAGAAAALVRLTDRTSFRLLGWLSIALVAILIGARGLGGILYPGLLVSAALAVVLVRSFVAGPLPDQQTQGSL